MIKKTGLYLIIFFTIINFVEAQQNGHQNLKLLKTSFITAAINLTPKEAEKFWPVYNMYSNEIQSLKIKQETSVKQKIRLVGGVDNLTDEDAKILLDIFITTEKQISDNEIKLVQELSKIISAKKIVALKKAERDFNRRILQEYTKRKRLQNN